MEEDYWIGQIGDTLISGGCPSLTCCQLEGGCDYVEDIQLLCALNRDSESYLCSRCIDGYSESMNSSNCTKCTKSVHWKYLMLSLCMALVIVMMLLWTNREKPEDVGIEKEMENIVNPKDMSMKDRVINKAKRLKDQKVKTALASLAKIAVYYEQVKMCIFCGFFRVFEVSSNFQSFVQFLVKSKHF